MMLSTSKIGEVSPNSCFFVVINFKMRKSRRLAAFLMLSSSKIEEVSQTGFVFKLADRETDGRTNGQRDRETERQRERERRQRDRQRERDREREIDRLDLFD